MEVLPTAVRDSKKYEGVVAPDSYRGLHPASTEPQRRKALDYAKVGLEENEKQFSGYGREMSEVVSHLNSQA